MYLTMRSVVILLVIAGFVFCAVSAWAQGEAGQQAGTAGTVSATQAIGNAVTIAVYSMQGMLSLILIALVVFYFLNIRVSTMVPVPVVEQMTEMLNRGAYDELMDFCKTTPTQLTDVIAAGLDKARKGGYQEGIKALEEKIAEHGLLIENRVSWFNFLYVIAPMLGLFGTVLGMVMAFDTFASNVNPQPTQLANGIRTALRATVFGLMIAMPSMAFFFYFRNRLARVLIEMGITCEGMFEHFRHASPQAPSPSSGQSA